MKTLSASSFILSAGSDLVDHGAGETGREGLESDLLGKREHNFSRLRRSCCCFVGHPLSIGGEVDILKRSTKIFIMFIILRALGAIPGPLDLLLTGVGVLLFAIISALAALHEKGDGDQVEEIHVCRPPLHIKINPLMNDLGDGDGQTVHEGLDRNLHFAEQGDVSIAISQVGLL